MLKNKYHSLIQNIHNNDSRSTSIFQETQLEAPYTTHTFGTRNSMDFTEANPINQLWSPLFSQNNDNDIYNQIKSIFQATTNQKHVLHSPSPRFFSGAHGHTEELLLRCPDHRPWCMQRVYPHGGRRHYLCRHVNLSCHERISWYFSRLIHHWKMGHR